MRTKEHVATVDRAMEWFDRLDGTRQKMAFRSLLEYAIDTDWIHMWSVQDKQELDDGLGDHDWDAPYFSSCGEPLV